MMNSSSDEVYDLLEAFLKRHAAPTRPKFEAWIEQHPEHSKELEVAWADWQRANARLNETSLFGSSQIAMRARQVVGPFTLVSELGSGGQAVVWKAEQTELGRHVALKLLRPGRASDRDLALFQREARAGAKLRHENVVAVYDSGREGDLSWIAQELIPGGRTLRDLIEETRREPTTPSSWYRQVATLVRATANALQLAHEAGIVHRDIKPQNVLLTPEGQPKISDFGLARLDGATAMSESGQLVGTYLYMSPEQVAAKRADIDHRTDVFSLGVVMYELLTLIRPFDGDTAHQICSRIITRDPVDPWSVRSQMPRELSVICCKALEKDRDRRYTDMAALADELDRFLTNRPILARTPTRLERTIKWARRHPTRSAAAAVASVAFVVISGLGVVLARTNQDLGTSNSSLQTRNAELRDETDRSRALESEANSERAKVAQERDRLLELVGFQRGFFRNLNQEAFGGLLKDAVHDQLEKRLTARGASDVESTAAIKELQRVLAPISFATVGSAALVNAVLKPASESVDERFGGDPLTRASMREAIAMAAKDIGAYELALELSEAAFATRQEILGDTSPDTLVSRNHLGDVLSTLGRYEEALIHYRAGLDAHRASDEQDVDGYLSTANGVAYALKKLRRFQEALELYSETLEQCRLSLGEGDWRTLTTARNKAYLLLAIGRVDAAHELAIRTLDVSTELLGEEHPGTIECLSLNAKALEMKGEHASALECYEYVLELRRATLGDQHTDTLASIDRLAFLAQSLGQLERAEPLRRELLNSSRAILGSAHPDTATCIGNLGSILVGLARYEEAEPLLVECAEWREARLGDHSETFVAYANLGSVLHILERPGDAIKYLAKAHAGLEMALPAGHPRVLGAATNLSISLISLERIDEAMELLEPVLDYVQHDRSDANTLGTVFERNGVRANLAACYEMLHTLLPDAGFGDTAAGLR